MSQLYDYFACPRPLAERWAEALGRQGESLQAELESAMPRLVTLRNVGDDDFNFLAACVGGDDFDPGDAIGNMDLVHAVDEAEGPWVLELSRPAVEAVAGLNVDAGLLDRWAGRVRVQRRGRRLRPTEAHRGGRRHVEGPVPVRRRAATPGLRLLLRLSGRLVRLRRIMRPPSERVWSRPSVLRFSSTRP